MTSTPARRRGRPPLSPADRGRGRSYYLPDHYHDALARYARANGHASANLGLVALIDLGMAADTVDVRALAQAQDIPLPEAVTELLERGAAYHPPRSPIPRGPDADPDPTS